MPPQLELVNEKIRLRPFEAQDIPALQGYLNHPELTGCRYQPDGISPVLPLSSKKIEEIYKKWSEAEKGLHLAIISRENQELLGHVSWEWEWDTHCQFLAVVIAPAQQRQGYGSQVLVHLLNYIFGHSPAHNITCWIADWNKNAIKFAFKHGFTESGRLRREGIWQGAYFDVVTVDILRPEWLRREREVSHAT